MIRLTDEERRKFSAYCEQEARAYSDLSKQLRMLPSGDAMARPIESKVAAFHIVACCVSQGEQVEILGGGDGN